MHTPPDNLLFVTGNAGKLREARAFLPIPVEGEAMHLPELQTMDAAELLRHKCLEAFARVGRPLFVEDTFLVFHAWGRLPGPYIKDFLGELGLEGLVRALEPFGDASAEAICHIAYHDGSGVHHFSGSVAGQVTHPRGEHGFGWDALFQPAGSQHTFGEMPLEEKQQHSMRARALQAFADFLAG